MVPFYLNQFRFLWINFLGRIQLSWDLQVPLQYGYIKECVVTNITTYMNRIHRFWRASIAFFHWNALCFASSNVITFFGCSTRLWYENAHIYISQDIKATSNSTKFSRVSSRTILQELVLMLTWHIWIHLKIFIEQFQS